MRASFILCLVLLFFACQEEKAVENTTNTIPEKVQKTIKKKPAKTIRIYDIRKDGTKGFVNIPVATTKGDPLRNAISQFFKSSHWAGKYRNIQLNRIGMINKQALFSFAGQATFCLLYTSPSPRDATLSRMPSSA